MTFALPKSGKLRINKNVRNKISGTKRAQELLKRLDKEKEDGKSRSERYTEI